MTEPTVQEMVQDVETMNRGIRCLLKSFMAKYDGIFVKDVALDIVYHGNGKKELVSVRTELDFEG
jgi:hypothetical protein